MTLYEVDVMTYNIHSKLIVMFVVQVMENTETQEQSKLLYVLDFQKQDTVLAVHVICF
jgi:hypothetical protein